MPLLEEQPWVVIDDQPCIPHTAVLRFTKMKNGVGGRYVVEMEHALQPRKMVVIARNLTGFASAQSFVHYLNGLRGGAFELNGREPRGIYQKYNEFSIGLP